MDSDTLAYIAFVATGAIFLADLIFNFLSKGWSDLLLIVWGVALLYFLIKNAVKSALREHDFDK